MTRLPRALKTKPDYRDSIAALASLKLLPNTTCHTLSGISHLMTWHLRRPWTFFTVTEPMRFFGSSRLYWIRLGMTNCQGAHRMPACAEQPKPHSGLS